MGQAESSQESPGAARPVEPAGWHCAKIEGSFDSKNEINVPPNKVRNEVGLGSGERSRKDFDFLPSESAISPRKALARGTPSNTRPDALDRPRAGRRRESDPFMHEVGSVTGSDYSDLGSLRNFTGPQSEGSFISGLSARSSGSRGSPPNSARGGSDHDDLDMTTAAMRVREQNEWDDTERDKDMFLRRIKAQVDPVPTDSRPYPGEDSLRPLPPSREAPRRGSSDAGYSDRTHDRHRGKMQQRGHGQRNLDTQSERSGRSAKSGFSLSSFRSAISGVSDRYGGRHREDARDDRQRSASRHHPDSPQHRDDRSDRSRRSSRDRDRDRDHRGHRDDSVSYHSPREYDEFEGRHSPRDRDYARGLALRDRDDDRSSGRGSHGSRRRGDSGGRRSSSRSASIGADARGPGRAVVPESRRGPGMSKWMQGPGESAASSDRGGGGMDRLDRLQVFEDGGGEKLISNDLEAKLKNAQKNLAEVQTELEEHKKEQERMKMKNKKKEMPGGNAVQHALMQDLRELRDYCVELGGIKEEQESQAKEAKDKLEEERLQRQEDIRARMDSEKLQSQLQSRIDGLTNEAKIKDSKLQVTSKDTKEMKELLTMIQSERDETLSLLRRAVAQKEKMKGDRQRESQESVDKFDRLQDQQKGAENKVRELLNSVDTLLGKFSLDKEDTKSQGSARSTVAVQLELMKIRDSIRFLLKANDSNEAPRQTGGQIPKKGTKR